MISYVYKTDIYKIDSRLYYAGYARERVWFPNSYINYRETIIDNHPIVIIPKLTQNVFTDIYLFDA